MLRKIIFVMISVMSSLLVATTASRACSVCFTGTSDSVTDGFNASVLFLMATPYLVVGSIAGGLIFAYRRALKNREKVETAEPIVHLGWHQEDSGR
jgi:hypothetical protein